MWLWGRLIENHDSAYKDAQVRCSCAGQSWTLAATGLEWAGDQGLVRKYSEFPTGSSLGLQLWKPPAVLQRNVPDSLANQ